MTKGKIDKINAWPPGTWLDLSHGMKSQTRNAANGVTFGAVVHTSADHDHTDHDYDHDHMIVGNDH